MFQASLLYRAKGFKKLFTRPSVFRHFILIPGILFSITGIIPVFIHSSFPLSPVWAKTNKVSVFNAKKQAPAKKVTHLEPETPTLAPFPTSTPQKQSNPGTNPNGNSPPPGSGYPQYSGYPNNGYNNGPNNNNYPGNGYNAPGYPQQPYPPYNPPYNSGSQSPPSMGNNPYTIPNSAGEGAENILIILDASYSMIERLPDGETKMVAAKRVILDFIKNLPPSVNVGLRIYGQSDNSFVACRATQLIMPISRNNHLAMASRLLGVKPTGATPITYALKTAINEDFRGITGKKSIILVSDGMETCDADPCDTAVEMVRAGVNVKINVIGLGLNDFNATKQLKCVALSTLGKYYGANTAAELARSLSQHGQDIQTDVQGQILTPTKR